MAKTFISHGWRAIKVSNFGLCKLIIIIILFYSTGVYKNWFSELYLFKSFLYFMITYMYFVCHLLFFLNFLIKVFTSTKDKNYANFIFFIFIFLQEKHVVSFELDLSACPQWLAQHKHFLTPVQDQSGFLQETWKL